MENGDSVFYLVFVSAAEEMFSDGELVSLLETARSHNSARGITGLLLYYEGCFIEIMEGSQEIVEWVFNERISKDPRHDRVMKLLTGVEPHRSFPDWSMGFTCVDKALLEKHLPNFNDILEIHADPEKAFPEMFHPLLVFLRSFYSASGYAANGKHLQ